jgi:hypothetical protein
VSAFRRAHGGAQVTSRPPRMGADTDAVLAELGYDQASIAKLRDAAVIQGLGSAPDPDICGEAAWSTDRHDATAPCRRPCARSRTRQGWCPLRHASSCVGLTRASIKKNESIQDGLPGLAWSGPAMTTHNRKSLHQLARPALAHCSSWSPVTPLTPTAPVTLPPTMIGTPPGEAKTPGSVAVAGLPLLITSANARVGRR